MCQTELTKEERQAEFDYMAEQSAQYPELAAEECCRHRYVNTTYLGDGRSENVCEICDYCWISTRNLDD
jgi:hypothetical protein